MSEIDRLLRRQAELAGRLAPETEPGMTLAESVAAMAVPAAAQQEQATGTAGNPPPRYEQEAPVAGAQTQQEAQTQMPGAETLWQTLLTLRSQRASAQALRQAQMEESSRRVMQEQSVRLLSRTPQNTPDGLMGGFTQTMTVAGPAAAPTAWSMAEISRFFERDARRYG